MLLEALVKESGLPLGRVAAFALIAGLSDALIVVIINAAAERASKGEANFSLFLFFTLALGGYILAQRYILRISTVQIEQMIGRVRIRLADKIRKSDLFPLENLGRSEIYSGINRDTMAVSQAAAPILIACQASLMVFFTIFYIGYLSPRAVLLTLGVIGLGVFVHLRRLRRIMADLQKSGASENEFFESLTHLLDGFKEVKLSRARSRDLFLHLQQIARVAAELKTHAGIQFTDQYLFSQASLNILVAVVVFVLPLLSDAESSRIIAITAAVQFISGPLTSLVGAIPAFSNANVAIGNIERLERQLEQLRSSSAPEEVWALKPRRPRFRTITLERVEMRYTDAAGEPLFTVGPLDMTIDRGDMIFLVGGNGSGKTTFLKLLTGLYYPHSGRLRIDGQNVDKFGYARYRELFSAIFTDYHLFDRLYGIKRIDERRVNELLRLMQLEEKTRYVDGRFENQDLSAGQKKRLALIVSMLEDKPIYVFDEWAADQDPSFRKFFYEELLEQFKSRGKTVIAATHDDRYFHVADRIIKMEMGQFVETLDMDADQRSNHRSSA
jgi:putative pyoverdin transport system ATP-binding/permease protein